MKSEKNTFIFFSNLLWGIGILLQLSAAGIDTAVEMILAQLSCLQLCWIAVLDKTKLMRWNRIRPSTVCKKVVRGKKCRLLTKIVEMVRKWPTDSLFRVKNDPSTEFDQTLEEIFWKLESHPEAMLDFLLNCEGLLKKKNQRWIFDTHFGHYKREPFRNVVFNPRHDTYAFVSSSEFYIKSLPTPHQKSKGKIVYHRQEINTDDYVDYEGVRLSWSPSGDYLAVVDYALHITLQFYRYFGLGHCLNPISNLCFTYRAEHLPINYKTLWSDYSTALIIDPNDSNQFLEITFNYDRTYKKKIVENLLVKKGLLSLQYPYRGFTGCSPHSTTLFTLTSCSYVSHHHDRIVFWRESEILGMINIPGSIVEHVVEENFLYVMLRTKDNLDTPCPIVKEVHSDCECWESNYDCTQKNCGKEEYHFWKFFRFLKINLFRLNVEFLPACLPLTDFEFGEVHEHYFFRFKEVARRERLSFSKDFLIFQSNSETFFISKILNLCLHKTKGKDLRCIFAHPKKPYLSVETDRKDRKYETDFSLSPAAKDLIWYFKFPVTKDIEYNGETLYKEIL